MTSATSRAASSRAASSRAKRSSGAAPAAAPAADRSARPEVRLTRPAKQPATAERVLPNGLRVVAVRRPAVPLVEVRLRVPFPGVRGDRGRTLPARADLLAETITSGTATRSALQLAEQLQAVGGGLSAGVDGDRLLVAGNALAAELPTLLALLADVLTGAAYPAREVDGERDRLAQDLVVARSQPGTLAGAALARRLYGDHPYGRLLPQADEVRAVTPAQLRSLHAQRVSPTGAVLLVVGDVRPATALDRVEAALDAWEARPAPAAAPALPPLAPGPLVLVDRPGAVQSNIRLAGPALRRDDPAYPALQLAHTVFGGYFSSRLVANVREDKGWSYGPRSQLDHSALGSTLVVAADVATEVTAPALLETTYELGRIATRPVTQDELDDARRYAVGTLALGTATQAGLASTLVALLGSGLPLDWLREHPQRLAAVTVDDVAAAAEQHLAPAGMVQVVLGDASRVAASLGALAPVEVQGTGDL